jgi:hypothetical protein
VGCTLFAPASAQFIIRISENLAFIERNPKTMKELFSKLLLLLFNLELLSVKVHGFIPLSSDVVRPSSSALSAETADGKDRRVPWEFGRFLQQSSKFVTLPSLFPRQRNKVVINPGKL